MTELTSLFALLSPEQQKEAEELAEQMVNECDRALRLTHIQWDQVRDYLLKPLAARVVLLDDCDCVPAMVSSRACHKCGRRAIITQEDFMKIVKQAEANHV